MSNDTLIINEIIELEPQELELIKSLRSKWRFGEVTILVRDGKPFRMVKVTEFTDLNKR